MGNFHNNASVGVLLSSMIYRWENWDTARLSDLHMLTHFKGQSQDLNLCIPAPETMLFPLRYTALQWYRLQIYIVVESLEIDCNI